MALLDSLPANWSTFTPAEKISYFNQEGVTPAELAQAGVSASDIAWMQSQGYTGSAAPVAAAPTTATIAPARAAVPAVPAQTDRLKEVDQWVYSKEPKAFQDLYKAVQSGEARIGLVPDEIKFDPDFGQIYGDYGVFDANGKFMPDVQVDPNTGVISVGTKNGVLRLSTNIGQGGTLAPIQGENYQNQVKYESFGNTWDEWGPAILGIGSLVGAPYLSSLIGGATGLTGAGLSAATGATIGGLGAAATGGDILKGALLGGAGGYLSNALTSGITDTNTLQAAFDADVAAGMVPEFGTNAAYDAFMTGAMTPAARAAIEAQIAGSSVAGMTPEQILQQGGMITDMAAGNFMGPQTAEQLGQGFEDYMRQGGYEPIPQADYSNEGRNYPTPESTQGIGGSPVNASTAAAAAGTGLSSKQIADLAKAGLSLASIVGAGGMLGGGATGPGVGALPTQGVPTSSPEYYQAIQQYYNAYMPNVPRDVATPLQQWYESKYGA